MGLFFFSSLHPILNLQMNLVQTSIRVDLSSLGLHGSEKAILHLLHIKSIILSRHHLAPQVGLEVSGPLLAILFELLSGDSLGLLELGDVATRELLGRFDEPFAVSLGLSGELSGELAETSFLDVSLLDRLIKVIHKLLSRVIERLRANNMFSGELVGGEETVVDGVLPLGHKSKIRASIQHTQISGSGSGIRNRSVFQQRPSNEIRGVALVDLVL
mmetsp:Transcript_11203/g.16947  ORF Transcript_11203/g.16947 Transcript_11203/m.16947 type:complete len:216 (-) Transcript_11203:226-873(-)